MVKTTISYNGWRVSEVFGTERPQGAQPNTRLLCAPTNWESATWRSTARRCPRNGEI